MLKNKEKINRYIDEKITRLQNEALESLNEGMDINTVLNQLVQRTVRKFTPESKILLNSVYNTLSKDTLSGEFFSDTHNKAEFYRRNILSDILKSFSFEIPHNIDYKDSGNKIKELIASGVIVVAGGVVSICVSNFIPFAISVVLAGIMNLIMRKRNKVNRNTEAKLIIQQYLESVKKSLILWLENIVEYYNKEVEKLTQKLKEE